MKRLALFMLVNVAVLVVIATVVQLLGLERYLQAYGVTIEGLLVLSAVFGFGGALISILLSKWLAVRSIGVRLIDAPQDPIESRLLATVANHAKRLNLGMPDVGIFDSPVMNAFATGPRRNHALIAVSSSLANSMSPRELEAVLGHEMSHVASGDMVTLGLLQGVLNTFVIFLARVMGSAIDGMIGGRREESEPGGLFYFLIVVILEILFGVLATLVVMAFSRHREFSADAGGAKLAGSESMIAALRALEMSVAEPLPGQLRAFGIRGGTSRGGLRRLFMSHPPIEDRIAALERSQRIY